MEDMLNLVNGAELLLNEPVKVKRAKHRRGKTFQRVWDALGLMATNHAESFTFKVSAEGRTKLSLHKVGDKFRGAFYSWHKDWQKKGNAPLQWRTTVSVTDEAMTFSVYDPEKVTTA